MVPGDLVRAGVAINHGRVALKMGAKNWRGRMRNEVRARTVSPPVCYRDIERLVITYRLRRATAASSTPMIASMRKARHRPTRYATLDTVGAGVGAGGSGCLRTGYGTVTLDTCRAACHSASTPASPSHRFATMASSFLAIAKIVFSDLEISACVAARDSFAAAWLWMAESNASMVPVTSSKNVAGRLCDRI